ncbi:MAG: hypothetical protein KatS3mg102_2059 [Planctomycetota bacterium]|nr:MAG: hypothetical protein KatS3mg102_2059 [Planctomycetota bacterium]
MSIKPPRPTQAMVPVELLPDPPRDLRDKVVLITGGASNIGRGTALAFARAGARVMIADLDSLAARETVADMQHLSPRCDWVRVNLLEDGDIELMVERCLATFGRVDVLINILRPRRRLRPAARDLGRAVRPRNARQRPPASALLPGGAAPHAARGRWFHRRRREHQWARHQPRLPPVRHREGRGAQPHAAHRELLRAPRHPGQHRLPGAYPDRPQLRPVRRNAISAAAYPIGRLGTIRDVVEACVYLASERSAFVTGAVLVVDGGLTAH